MSWCCQRCRRKRFIFATGGNRDQVRAAERMLDQALETARLQRRRERHTREVLA